MSEHPRSAHAKPRTSMAWWGHLVVLTLIFGGTGVSVLTGNPLYAVLLILAAWYIGARLSRAPRRVDTGLETADLHIVSKAGQSFVLREDGSRARIVSL